MHHIKWQRLIKLQNSACQGPGDGTTIFSPLALNLDSKSALILIDANHFIPIIRCQEEELTCGVITEVAIV